MDPEILQHAIVTLAAAGAAWVVVRRVVGVVKPTGGSSCASCPSARAHGKLPAASSSAETHPMTLVR